MQIHDEHTIYVYIGGGLGIPGLPHRVTRAEAVKMQSEIQLDAAIQAGVYVIAPTDQGIAAPLKNAARNDISAKE